MSEMIIYHGVPTPKKMKKIRKAAPEYKHGACWLPDKMAKHDWEYILDNGCYSAWNKNKTWEPDGFLKSIGKIEDMPRKPYFIVAPDIVGKGRASLTLSITFKRMVERDDFFLPIQKGMDEDMVKPYIDEFKGLFIGGLVYWSKSEVQDWVEFAHDNDLLIHIGRTSNLQLLKWAERIGSDSVDTTSIVRNQNYSILENLSNQSKLEVKV